MRIATTRQAEGTVHISRLKKEMRHKAKGFVGGAGF